MLIAPAAPESNESMLDRRTLLHRAACMALLVAAPRRVSAAVPPPSAERLAGLVERFAAVQHHRTGTGPERRTTRWFARELARRGADVALRWYAFTRCSARASVRIGGMAVACEPLPYAWSGQIATRSPAVGTVLLQGNLDPVDLDARIAAARAAGAPALVLATTSTFAAGGRLILPNRAPVPGAGLPVVLVGGAHAEALATRPVEVRARAALVTARSANVVAWFRDTGGGAAAPVVIATPLSGWFRCAAERGSGVAIALELASRLATERPVVVVGTTGHELDYLGLRRLLDEATLPVPRLVVHLGASLAAMTDDGLGGRVLAPLRPFGDDLDTATHAAVAEALAPVGFRALPSGTFAGEGAVWHGRGAPVLSFSGTFPLFHTPDDVPERTIEPAALGRVYAAVAQAVDAALAGVDAR